MSQTQSKDKSHPIPHNNGNDMNNKTNGDFLTLGDGDFTFSYDLCRFLQCHASFQLFQKQNQQKIQKIQKIHPQQHQNQEKGIKEEQNNINIHYDITCSGIDSIEELEYKYHDVKFTLKKLHSLNGYIPSINSSKNTSSSSSSSLAISIQHEVNAIIIPSNQPINPLKRYKHVIFNHPHVGVEDAKRHSRFISHLFHSVTNYWLAKGTKMKKTQTIKNDNEHYEVNSDTSITTTTTTTCADAGVFHLTLVKGQFERWKCQESAKKHGLIILNRFDFQPPPSPGIYIHTLMKEYYECIVGTKEENITMKELLSFQSKEDYKTRFQYRRHQSGRSFASRVGEGSETITFGRIEDEGCYSSLHLPWQNLTLTTDDNKNEKCIEFVCPHCNKVFGDNRARKNHIKCVHERGNLGKTTTSHHDLFCNLCQDPESKKRVYTNEDALNAHKKAKHSGKHVNIKPDWAGTCSSTIHEDNHVSVDISCDICGMKFRTIEEKDNHLNEFIPIASKDDIITEHFQCEECGKKFKDIRARMQHENFCNRSTNDKN